METWDGHQLPDPQQEQGHRDLVGSNQERTSLHGSNLHKMGIKSPLCGLCCWSLIRSSQESKGTFDLIQKRDPREMRMYVY